MSSGERVSGAGEIDAERRWIALARISTMLGAMNFSWRVGRVVVVGLVLAAGCGGSVASNGGNGGNGGGSGGQGQTAPGGLSAATFPTQLAQLACATLEPCCAADQLPFDRAACLDGLTDGPVHSGDGIAFDSAAAQRCLDEFVSATHGCSAFDKSQIPDCNRLTQGTLPVGSTCTSDRQCAASSGRSATCDYAPNGTTGSCALVQATPHAALGGPCNATCAADNNCEEGSAPSVSAPGTSPPVASGNCYLADGLYCAWDSQQCQSIGNSGDTCHAREGCVSGLACVGLADSSTTNNGTTHAGTCAPPQPEGAPCINANDCAKLACDPATGLCAHVPFATAGLCQGMLPGAD